MQGDRAYTDLKCEQEREKWEFSPISILKNKEKQKNPKSLLVVTTEFCFIISKHQELKIFYFKKVNCQRTQTYLYMFVRSIIIHYSKKMEITQVSINRWMDFFLMWYIHIMDYYSTFKKEILQYVTVWAKSLDIMLSDNVRKGQILHGSTCMRNLT